MSRVELLDSLSQSPLQEYLQLPTGPTWLTCSNHSSLKVWLPGGSSSARSASGSRGSSASQGCMGLDFVVALQQETTHSIG